MRNWCGESPIEVATLAPVALNGLCSYWLCLISSKISALVLLGYAITARKML